MAKYNRVKGGEKNERTGVPFSKAELLKVYDLYVEMDGKGIHENNPKIHSLANLLDRTIRSVENQLLGFRLVDTGNTGRANYNKLIKEIWDERLEEKTARQTKLLQTRDDRRKTRLIADEFKFRISSHLKDIIGKELITDDYVAIFELVKNSFDAHANRVKIIFEEDKITVWDNGKGMDKEDIVDKWLFVAYSAKREGVEDAEFELPKNESYRDRIVPKKLFAGAKGIGRFSADRLGEKLVLTTKKITDNSPYWRLSFCWDDFEKDAEEEFVDIAINYEKLEKSPIDGFLNGVILEISGLRSIWNRARMLSLKSSLEKLINPFAKTDRKDGHSSFQIEIICPHEQQEDEGIKKNKKDYNHREVVNGNVGNFVFQTLNIKTTSIKILVEEDKLVTTLTDRGQLIYEIEEPNPYNYIPENSSVELFYLNQSAKKSFTQLMGITPKDFGSIFVFNNGFRVFPIGEPGDDPFRIDARKVQGYSRFLGTRELIGSIEIWGQSEHFTESSSRDGGLDASVGTAQLEEFFMEGLRRLEKFVQPILWQIRRRTGSEDEEIDIDAKAEIIDLVAKLAGNGEIKLRNFSKDFLNILDEKSEISTPQVFDNLKKIAENAGDQQFRNEIDRSELEFIKIQQARDEEEYLRKEAEERERKEKEKRRAAEQKAKEEEDRRKEEEYKRLKAEENERKEAEKRRIAENDLLKKEKERAEAKVAQLLAEKLAREAAEENKKLSYELDAEKKKSLWQGALLGTDKERIIGLQHQIFHSSSRISRNIGLLLKHLGSGAVDEATKKHIVIMSLEATKINSIANFITKANFNLKATEITTDIVSFVSEYIKEVYVGDDKVIDANVGIRINYEEETEYMKEIRPIEVTTLFDNLISNAEKAGAKLVTISFRRKGNNLVIEVANDGMEPIPQEHLERIFELGFTTTGGTGIGLFQSRDIVKRLGGEIVATSNIENGTKFTITI